MTILEDFRLNRVEPRREIGIEIEAEGKNLHFPENIGYWKVTQDGSLRGHSCEYVLKQPCNREQVAKRLGYLKAMLANQRGEIVPSDRAGVHIHVNCQHSSFWEVMNFACLYLILEHPMVKYCGPDREGNMFCLRAEDAEYLIDSLCAAAEVESFQSMQSNALRYASINFSSLSKYGSLEFRGLRTPADITSIKDWVDMLMLLKDAAGKYKRPMEIIESMSGAGPKSFMSGIIGSYANKLRYKGYEKDLWRGVRLVQDVAFTRPMSPSDRATGQRSRLDPDADMEDDSTPPRFFPEGRYTQRRRGQDRQANNISWSEMIPTATATWPPPPSLQPGEAIRAAEEAATGVGPRRVQYVFGENGARTRTVERRGNEWVEVEAEEASTPDGDTHP